MKLLTFVLRPPPSLSLPRRRLLLFAVLPPAASPPSFLPSFLPSFPFSFIQFPILLPSFPPFQWHLYLQVYGCRRMWDPMPRTPCHVVSLFCITVLELEKPLPDGPDRKRESQRGSDSTPINEVEGSDDATHIMRSLSLCLSSTLSPRS